MRIFIIGAAGRVGSAALVACLAKQHTVTAFVRNPSSLPFEIQEHPRLHILRGDSSSHLSLVEAIKDQDAIIQAAVHGSNSPLGTHDNEKITRCIIKAVKEVQSGRRMQGPPIRVWVLSGHVLLNVPGAEGNIEGIMIPIHPKYYKDYAFLQQDARSIEWNFQCPGKIDSGEVRVLLYECR